MSSWVKSTEYFVKGKYNGDPYHTIRCQKSDRNWPIKHFKSFEDMLAFYNANKHASANPHYFEYLHDAKRQVYMFFDIEKTWLQDETPQRSEYHDICHLVITTFVTQLNKYLTAHYSGIPELVNGHNMHIGWTDYIDDGHDKVSFHLKANVLFPESQTLKSFAGQFVNYISHQDARTRDILSFKQEQTAQDGTKQIINAPVLDLSVYKTKNYSLRALYSSKINKHGRMLPYNDASPEIKHHLVVYHPENPQPNCVHFTSVLTNIPRHLSADQRKNQALSEALIPVTRTHYNSTQHDTEDEHIPPDIPNHALDDVESILKTSPLIKSTFDTGSFLEFTGCDFFKPHIYNFYVDHISTPVCCPYAGRRHKNNRGYFQYNHTKKTITFKCFDDACKSPQHPVKYRVCSVSHQLALEDDLANFATLHDREDSITWSETYNDPQMRPYPSQPTIIAIKGNMGTGKTETLITHTINKYCRNPDTKCLFITYQRILSRKFIKDLAEYGFQNYLDATSPPATPNPSTSSYSPPRHFSVFDAKKLIVCLDSLHKVRNTHFDYVFIDECLSVLHHFQSPLMKHVNTVALKFEQHVLQAKHMYFIDANVDNMLVHNVIQYISTRRNTIPYYIRNLHVRNSNRRAFVTHNRDHTNSLAVKALVIDTVSRLLKSNKNVVVAASTKRLTDTLANHISKTFPAKKCIIYNSNTDQRLIAEHAENINDIWSQYDIVIYSPTIGAGLSFERPHFHALVAYAENSPCTPTVDLTIQQLYRVRQLIDGEMHVFINDTYTKSSKTEQEIEDMLTLKAQNMATYCEKHHINECLATMAQVFNPTSSEIEFDKDRLSYEVIKGCIYNKNKSYANYGVMLCNALKDDYNVPITYIDAHRLKANKQTLKTLNSEYATQQVKFSKSLLPDENTYQALHIRQQEHYQGVEPAPEPLTDFEKQQLWTYMCVHNIWQIDPTKFDKDFYDMYVGPYTKSNAAKIYELATGARHHCMFLDNDTQQLKSIYTQDMIDILIDKDRNHRLHRSKRMCLMQRLLEASRMFDIIFDVEDYVSRVKTMLKNGGGFTMFNNDFKERVRKYFETITDEDFTRLKELFEIRTMAETRSDALATIATGSQQACKIVNTIFNKGMMVSVWATTKTHNPKHIMYGSKQIIVDPVIKTLMNYKTS